MEIGKWDLKEIEKELKHNRVILEKILWEIKESNENSKHLEEILRAVNQSNHNDVTPNHIINKSVSGE